LNKLLPNNEWKGFTLETNTVIEHFSSPIHIHDHYPRPYWQPWYTMAMNANVNSAALNLSSNNLMASAKDADYSLKSGVFNVEA